MTAAESYEAALERALDQAEAQGLPRYVTDPNVAARLARLLSRVAA